MALRGIAVRCFRPRSIPIRAYCVGTKITMKKNNIKHLPAKIITARRVASMNVNMQSFGASDVIQRRVLNFSKSLQMNDLTRKFVGALVSTTYTRSSYIEAVHREFSKIMRSNNKDIFIVSEVALVLGMCAAISLQCTSSYFCS